MVDQAEIVGRRIVGVFESKNPEQFTQQELPSTAQPTWFNWYLQLDSGKFLLVSAETLDVIQEPPEPVGPTRVNATKVVPGDANFKNATFVSEAIRTKTIAETRFARLHVFLTESDTRNLIVGRQISDVIVGTGGLSETRLILVLDCENHLSVWNQEDGILLQFDELDRELDSHDDEYHRYFDGTCCDAFGTTIGNRTDS